LFGYIFRALGDSRLARKLLAGNPVGRRLARRFVAGESLQDALTVSRALASSRMHIALAFLGEHLTDESEVRRSTEVYIQAAHEVATAGLPAYLSPKPTQLGLDIDEELCRSQLRRILEAAAAGGLFVCLDMEGSKYTETTIRLVEELRGEFPRLGTVLQAYLHRTRDDLDRLLSQEITIRIVKGAYNEPADIAFQSSDEVEDNYKQLVEVALDSGVPVAIATHNDSLLEHARRSAAARETPLDNLEFQMLYGIRRAEQERIVAQGHSMRVYLPFGPDWFPYFMRRLGERPANALFVLRNLFR
jgi:proline dehydrogenase